MTDVRVSNARRIGFTALAIVSFWIVAWRLYWMSVAAILNDGATFFDPTPIFESLHHHPWNTTAALTALPTIFLAVSTHDGLRGLCGPFVVISGLMFASTFRLNIWLGWSDVSFLSDHSWVIGQRWYQWHLTSGSHDCSWPWLLLPIILTTAFVIFGAWRRAVRDAEVEVVGEGVTGDRLRH